MTVLTLPWSAYEGFFREHQYGMSNQTLFAWLTDQFKGLVLTLILVPPSLAVLYAVVRKSTRNWWLWGAVVAMVLMTFQLLIGPAYLEPVFNKFYPLAESPLKQQLLSMARANEIPAQQIYEFDASKQTTKMSAHVSGLLGTAQISLNDNLMQRGSPEEIKAVVGHEMGHYVLNHDYKGLLAIGRSSWSPASHSWRGRSSGLTRRYAQALGDPRHHRRGRAAAAGGAVFGLSVRADPGAQYHHAQHGDRGRRSSASTPRASPTALRKAALHLSEYRKMQPGPLEEALLFDHPSGWNRIHRAMVWKAENIDAADIASYDASHHPPGTTP